MRLSDYIERNHLKAVGLARALGVNPSAVHKWCAPRCNPVATIPRAADMARIYEITDGCVGPADFYDLPSVRGARRRSMTTIYALATSLMEREPGAPLAAFALRSIADPLVAGAPGALRRLEMALADALSRALGATEEAA